MHRNHRHAVQHTCHGKTIIGGLFREVTRNSVELTITERIWGMIIDIVNEIAQCFEIEDEKIFETLINRSDKLQHFIQIYKLKMAS